MKRYRDVENPQKSIKHIKEIFVKTSGSRKPNHILYNHIVYETRGIIVPMET